MTRNSYLSRRISLIFLITIKTLERFSYYGFRSIIVLYAIDETVGLELSNETALAYYGSLTMLISLLPLPAGMLSDRLLGQRNGVLSGLVIAAIGCGILIAEGFMAAALGCLLLLIGSSLTSVNLPILIGDHFDRKDRKRNLVFILFFLAINIGAFLGALGLGVLASDYSFQYGFGVAAVALLVATLLFLSVQNKLPILEYQVEKTNYTNTTILDAELTKTPVLVHQLPPRNALLTITVVSIITGIFWAMYEVYGNIFDERTEEIETLQLFGNEIFRSWSYSFNSMFSLVALIAFLLLWWWRGVGSSISKMAIGCLLLGSSFLILQLAMNAPVEQFLNIALIPAMLLGITEVFIAPIGIAYITRLSDPRYGATIYGGFILVIYLLSSVAGFMTYLFDNQIVIVAGVASVLLGIGVFASKKLLVRWSGGID